MKITKEQLRKLILEAAHDDEGVSEEEYEPLSRDQEDKLSKLLNPDHIGQAASLATTIAGPDAFSKLVKTTLERNEVLENRLTDNMFHDIENIVMDIFNRGLNSVQITISNQEGLLNMEDTGITEDEEHDIYMELISGVRQNIRIGIENAIVQTLVAMTGGSQ